MSFVGTLEDLPLPDLLQALAAGRKSGRLTLSERDGYGLVVFREGKIVYAASNSARETLGSILVCRGLVDEAALTQALATQHRLQERRRLGSVLLDMGVISLETLEAVLRQQIETVLSELLRWERGFFRVEPEFASAESDEVEVDVKDLLLHEGLAAKDAVLEAARLVDEGSRQGGAGREAAGRTVDATAKAGSTAGQAVEARRADEDSELEGRSLSDLASLKAMMAAVQSPAVTAETTLLLLRYAARAVERAVLFAPRRDAIRGLAQHGLSIDEADDEVRSLRVPWDEPSILGEVAQRRESFRGPLPAASGNQLLINAFGGESPAEVVVVPMLVGGRTALLLYGDNAPHGAPIGSIDGLELMLMQTGLALEKKLLEERLERLAAASGSAEGR
jgi:hypothetical protein